MSTILVISPQQLLNKEIKQVLEKEGYKTETALNAAAGLDKAERKKPDLFVIDTEQNDISCRSICQSLRGEFPEIPVLIILNKESVKKYPNYHNLGADDFVYKPIDVQELAARTKALLTPQDSKSETLKAGDIELDKRTYTVRRGGRAINLTPREFELLEYLMLNKNRVLSRDLILSRVWEYDFDAQTRAVDVYISYLRNKLNKKGEENLIKTVRGFGYVLKTKKPSG